MVVLKYDKKSKEERAKCEEQCKNERVGVRGNVKLRFRKRLCERRVSEVIKTVDSARNLEERMQNKCGENGNMLT